MRAFANITSNVRSFVDQHRPTISEEPITEPLGAFNAVAKCKACEVGVKKVQSAFLDDFVQNLVVRGFDDVCWLLGSVLTYDACSLYVEQAAPSILENLAGLIVSPEYSCEVELHFCNREWYSVDTVEAYAQRILKDKPAALQDDDFMNQLYR